MIVDQRVIDNVVNQPLEVSIPISLIALSVFSLMAGFYLATQIWKDSNRATANRLRYRSKGRTSPSSSMSSHLSSPHE